MKISDTERGRRYIAKCPPSIEDHGGDSAAYRVACVLVQGFGLSETEALMLMREWNARCLPPWNEHDLGRKITCAAKAPHAKPRGYLLGARGGDCQAHISNSQAGPAAMAIAQVRVTKAKFCPMTSKRIAANTNLRSERN